MNVLDQVEAFIRKRRRSTGIPASTDTALSLGNLAQLSLEEKERYVRALLPIALTNGKIREAESGQYPELPSQRHTGWRPNLAIEDTSRANAPADPNSSGA